MRHTISVSGTHMKVVVYESDTDRILDKDSPLVTTVNLQVMGDSDGEPTWVRIELPKLSMQDIARLFNALGAQFETEFFREHKVVSADTRRILP